MISKTGIVEKPGLPIPPCPPGFGDPHIDWWLGRTLSMLSWASSLVLQKGTVRSIFQWSQTGIGSALGSGKTVD